MKKKTGSIIIECYDKYAHKVKSITPEINTYIEALKISQVWEGKNEGNTAVISKILYNSVCKSDKWSYTGKKG